LYRDFSVLRRTRFKCYNTSGKICETSKRGEKLLRNGFPDHFIRGRFFPAIGVFDGPGLQKDKRCSTNAHGNDKRDDESLAHIPVFVFDVH
jgi:hypothetical protein